MGLEASSFIKFGAITALSLIGGHHDPSLLAHHPHDFAGFGEVIPVSASDGPGDIGDLHRISLQDPQGQMFFWDIDDHLQSIEAERAAFYKALDIISARVHEGALDHGVLDEYQRQLNEVMRLRGALLSESDHLRGEVSEDFGNDGRLDQGELDSIDRDTASYNETLHRYNSAVERLREIGRMGLTARSA